MANKLARKGIGLTHKGQDIALLGSTAPDWF